MGLREEKEQLTRQQIIDAAFQLFCENGIEATELMQIAKQAKVSRPTLYRYFESKEILAEEVYLDNLQKLLIASIEFEDGVTTYQMVELFFNIIMRDLKEQPARLVYDAIYNLYASRIHVDPTTSAHHPLNFPKYQKLLTHDLVIQPDDSLSASIGEGGTLLHVVVFPFFSYVQRLAIFSFQKGVAAWAETIREAEMLHDFYLKTLKSDV